MPITRRIIAIAVSAGLRGELGGGPFEALLMLVVASAVRTDAAVAISGLVPLSARDVVGAFPFGALLMLGLGLAVRTDAAFAICTGAVFAISDLLPLRLALNMVVDRRLDLIFFLAMDSPVESVCGEVLPPKKSDASAHRCAFALAEREGGPF
jgi:hypothetical protein